MSDQGVTSEERRRQAKMLNERLKLTSSTIANGGLSLIAAGIGLWYATGANSWYGMMIVAGFITIFVGIGLLEQMRSED